MTDVSGDQSEALLCGFIYDADYFETIARAGVTRYLAADLTVEAMNAYRLNMIPDYIGGPGCSGHGHDHDGCCDEAP